MPFHRGNAGRRGCSGSISRRLSVAATLLGIASGVAAPVADADFEDLVGDLLPTADWGAPFDAAHWSAQSDTAHWSAQSDTAHWIDPNSGPHSAASSDPTPPGTVPLTSENTRAIINLSAGGGPEVPVIVDTGSSGLVLPFYDLGLGNLGFPTGIHIARYGLFEYVVYAGVPTTIDFGNGITTGTTTVDAELFAFPEALNVGLQPAVGILGVGPNALGPNQESPVSALPGDLSQGVLIDQPRGLLQFGPNPLLAGESVSGAPLTQLGIQVGDGPVHPVTAAIDSGGVAGIFPSSMVGNANTAGSLLGGFGQVTPGTRISVYADDGQRLLYSYVAEPPNNDPLVVPDVLLPLLYGFTNTGNTPFALGPIYISNSPSGVGQTIFASPPGDRQ